MGQNNGLVNRAGEEKRMDSNDIHLRASPNSSLFIMWMSAESGSPTTEVVNIDN